MNICDTTAMGTRFILFEWMRTGHWENQKINTYIMNKLNPLKDIISILIKIFLGLVQGCTRLHNRHKTKSCKCHKLCPNSDKLLHRNRSRVSHAYYIVSASLKVHRYTSRTCPESLSNCLFADVVVIVINIIHGYSSFPLHWATLKYMCACLFTQLVP